jgi:hypothetical protein
MGRESDASPPGRRRELEFKFELEKSQGPRLEAGREKWRSNFALRLGLRGEFDGLLDCDQQAALVRLARARDIEGCSVIDRGADNWQANRDIYSGFDAEHLHWTVALVVIHGYDDVKVPAPGAKEKRIGGQRPFNVPAAGPTGLDSRFDLGFFLAIPE